MLSYTLFRLYCISSLFAIILFINILVVFKLIKQTRIKNKFAGKIQVNKSKGDFMNNLTGKEVTFISDLLTQEGRACKKARIYSRTLTDKNLAETMSKIADNHEKRYNALLDLL